MNRIVINHYRYFKSASSQWNKKYSNGIPIITLSRSLDYHTLHPALLHNNIKYEPPHALRGYIGAIAARPFSLSHTHYEKEPLKPSSKVEATVQTLKEDTNITPKTETKKPLRQRIMDELRHYYHGFRLLGIEIRISTGLVWRILKGETLSRREHRLLVTTIGDLFRMVPFVVFIVVPFLEFALPVVLKMFPGMLPSTFETKDQRDKKLKLHLKAKLEIAKFFQETLDQMAPQAGNRHSELAKEFASFFNRIRTSGEMAKSSDIMKFSKLFENEITLDNLTRPHLVGLCRVLNVSTIGTNAMLRFSLRMKLRSLAADDKMIAKEGVDSLNFNELQQACKARGMRAYGVSEERLRKELKNWLDLALNEKVPQSLLLLSRVLMVPDHVSTSSKLQATISALPEEVVLTAKAAIGEKEGKVDFKTKVEAIKLEELKIKQEKKEMLEAEAEKNILENMKKEILLDSAPVIDTKKEKTMFDPAPVIAVDSKPKKTEEGLSSKDIEIIEDAIENLAHSKKSLLLEKESIQDLKEEMSDYTEDVKELQEMVKSNKADIKLTKGARRLYRAVNSMISKMDHVLGELENKEKDLKNTLQQKEVEQPQATKEQLIHIDELMNSIKNLKKVPDEAKLKLIQDVLGRLDDDFDGQLKVDDVLKMVQIIGNEHVHLSEKQMAELIELLDKEELLEVENKIQKALDKAADDEKKSTEQANNSKSLFDLIREAQAKREQKQAAKQPTDPKLIPKTKDIITKQEDTKTRPENQ